jgi:hypothetical protein
MDAALLEVPGYDEIEVTFRVGTSSASRDAHGIIPGKVFAGLLYDHSAPNDRTIIMHRNGSFIVMIDVYRDADVRSIARRLGGSGLPTLVGATVQVDVQVQDYYAVFVVGETLTFEESSIMTDEQRAEFTAGWELGLGDG